MSKIRVEHPELGPVARIEVPPDAPADPLTALRQMTADADRGPCMWRCDPRPSTRASIAWLKEHSTRALDLSPEPPPYWDDARFGPWSAVPGLFAHDPGAGAHGAGGSYELAPRVGCWEGDYTDGNWDRSLPEETPPDEAEEVSRIRVALLRGGGWVFDGRWWTHPLALDRKYGGSHLRSDGVWDPDYKNPLVQSQHDEHTAYGYHKTQIGTGVSPSDRALFDRVDAEYARWSSGNRSRAWLMNFQVTGRAGDVFVVSRAPCVLFKPEILRATDSVGGRGTVMVHCWAYQRSALADNTPTAAAVEVDLHDLAGLLHASCMPFWFVVRFLEDCTWQAGVFGRGQI